MKGGEAESRSLESLYLAVYAVALILMALFKEHYLGLK